MFCLLALCLMMLVNCFRICSRSVCRAMLVLSWRLSSSVCKGRRFDSSFVGGRFCW